MDFVINKEAQTVEITKEFDAPRDLVWDAYTKQELLDQWWAPKPWTSRTKAMEFREGGRRFYAMVSPEGTEKWSVQKYTSITPKTNFKLVNAFADENENLELPGSDWDLTFTEHEGRTTVTVSIYNESLERMEQILAMGFREGFTMTLGQLEELLARVSRTAGRPVTGAIKQAKNTICLWYDKDAEAAARFYAATFPDSSVGAVQRAPGDYPAGKEGDVITVEFTVMNIPCIGLNGGPELKHNEAFSFQIATRDQEETDRYWNAIVDNGGQESMCGWCKDKWGVSWQITPRVLTEGYTDPDPAVAKRVFEAMMTMKKIDIATIEAARRGK